MRHKIGRFLRRIKKIINSIIVYNGKEDISYKILDFIISLPSDHKLPQYQQTFKNYDKKLKNIIQSISKFQSIDFIIDIGANVGDTAALMRSHTKSKIICIEGDQVFLKYLVKNSKVIPDLVIVDSYVGSEDEIFKGEVTRNNGTAKIIEKEDKIKNLVEVKTRSLNSILSNLKIDPDKIQLIKIDTDGFDFKILDSNKALIKQYKPNIYFEYDINFNANDATDGLNIVSFFESIQYILVVYDNFGNLIDLIQDNHLVRFERYNHWLKSTKIYGGGIYYLDIFATTSTKIANDVIANDCIEILTNN